MTSTRHVFVSFASPDAELAHRAVQALEHGGQRCWIADRDIPPASSYPAEVTAAVRGSGVVVLLLTESANASPHVLREVELAFNSRRPILPVRIAGATPSPDLQYFLSTAQWFDAGPTLDDAEIARVRSRIDELLRDARAGRERGTRQGRRVGLLLAGVALIVAVALFAWSTRSDDDPARLMSRTNPRDGQVYVWVPAGRFVLGCSPGDSACEDDEQPAHAVEIPRGFWLSRTEVTEAQYRNVAAGGSGGTEPQRELPVTGVSWASAKAYCAAIGGRLPTEAEWEYAARGGTASSSYGPVADAAWFADNSGDRPQPVGTKAANAFGLHDMLGNVSEWVLDRYYDAYEPGSGAAAVEQPLAGNASAVARGGSWLSDAGGVRVSRRLPMPPDAEEAHIGFRCALDDP